MALFAIEDLGAMLQVADIDTAAATRARSQAETYLRTHLAVEFALEERTHTERVPRATTSTRLRGPLVAVTSVTADGTELDATLWTRTRAGVACPGGFGQELTTEGDWCDLAITYEAGFATVPTDLADWGLWLAVAALTRPPGGAVAQQAVGAVSANYGSAAPVDALRLPGDILRTLQRTYGRATPAMVGSVDIR